MSATDNLSQHQFPKSGYAGSVHPEDEESIPDEVRYLTRL